jgi:hypothetical protein
MRCRICWDTENDLLTPCGCKGTIPGICQTCLDKLEAERCQTCLQIYKGKKKEISYTFEGDSCVPCIPILFVFFLIWGLLETNSWLGVECRPILLRQDLPALTYKEFFQIDSALTCDEIKRRIAAPIIKGGEDVLQHYMSEHLVQVYKYEWKYARNCGHTHTSFFKTLPADIQDHHRKMMEIAYGWEQNAAYLHCTEEDGCVYKASTPHV